MKARVIDKEQSVIYKRQIYKFNDEFEVDEAVGKSLCKRGLVEVVTDNPDLFEEDEVVDLTKNVDEMSYQELKAYASDLGLSASGKKDELIERIKEFLCGVEEIDGVADETVDEELPNTEMPE